MTHCEKGSVTIGHRSTTPSDAAILALILVGRGRRDAVDHRCRAENFTRDERAELGIAERREAVEQPLHQTAVRRKIIAAEDGERFNPRCATPRNRLGNQSDRSSRRVLSAEIMDDIGMRLVQGSGGGVVAIALLRHGQRNNTDAWIGHCRKQMLALVRSHQDIDNAADDAEPFSLPGPDGESIKAILRLQRIARLPAAKACTNNRPARVLG